MLNNVDAFAADFEEADVEYVSGADRAPWEIINFIADMVSKRALIGWTTHGHTGVDVNLYAYGSNT